MAGTCGGSCAVGVDEILYVSARSVASSDVIGAIVLSSPRHTISIESRMQREVDRKMVGKKVDAPG